MKTLIALVFTFLTLQAQAIDCSRQAGSLPKSQVQAGTEDSKNPIQHVLVLMQENHSFDQYFGRLNQPNFYGQDVDGVTDQMSNLDASGKPAYAYHETNLCIADPNHMWNDEHWSWDNGKNDKFVIANGPRMLAYYDQTNIPYYYALANNFAIADRYFCSLLSSTYPNRFYLMAGTSFGHIYNDEPKSRDQFSQKTIFDELDQYHISWKYYSDDTGYLTLFLPMWSRDKAKMFKIADYKKDAAEGNLPQVAFIDAEFDTVDEHPNSDVQVGESWVADIIDNLSKSPNWKSAALFLTYDENGGFFDHVAPPEACEPDDIAPMTGPSEFPGMFDRYGFRVPFTLVSPYAKHHYVSHRVYDHTSILKFIETKFNLPALTRRDANADAMLDLFDFNHPIFEMPKLPQASIDTNADCVNSDGH